jgi:hypothetical protein
LFAFFALFCAITLARVVEPTHKTPVGWMRMGEPQGSQEITLHLALHQQNMNVLEETLLRISDPREETYGQWLSLDEISDIISPHPKDFAEVENWLTSHGITTI